MLVRMALIAAFPAIIFWSFVSELMRGFRYAFRMAYLEVRIEISSFRNHWNRKDI